MPSLDEEITNFIAGDDLNIRRTITGVPSGETIAKAWLTVKDRPAQSDDDAVLQKQVTTSETAEGHITDDGAGDEEGEVLFKLVPADTLAIGKDKPKAFDIQVLLSGGRLTTPFRGVIFATDTEVTKATS